MSFYVVRNKEQKTRYLNRGFGGSTSVPFKEAHVFTSLASANIERDKYETWRETRKVVWAIKMTGDSGAVFYALPDTVEAFGARHEAGLFDSLLVARAAKALAALRAHENGLPVKFTIVRSTKAVT